MGTGQYERLAILLRRIAVALEASVKLAEEANKRTAEFADKLAKLP